MAWRSKKILALLPPGDSEESDVESDDDIEGKIAAREFLDSNTSSPIREMSPGLYYLLQDLSDHEDTLDEERTTVVSERPPPVVLVESSPSTSTSNNQTHCYIPETPSPMSVPTPSTSSATTSSIMKVIRRTRQTAVAETSPMPLPVRNPPRKRKMKQLDFTFKKRKYTGSVDISGSTNFEEKSEIWTPQQYFQQFFDVKILDFIVEMTNLYSVQATGKSICVTRKEIEILLGIEIMMGVVDMPAVEDYWSFDLRYEQIASNMSLKRYRTIKRYLNFCDNTNYNKNDSYYKISSIMEHLRKKCLEIEEERSFAVDEMIIPYKGKKAGSRKQYNPKKPHKWG